MELLGYIEEYGKVKSIRLVGTNYQPSDYFQKLEVIDDSGKQGSLWAKLVAIEQPLFN